MAETARLEAVRAALERPSPETGPDGTPSLAVAVEIEDAAIIERSGRGDRLAAGSLRWLADRDDEGPASG